MSFKSTLTLSFGRFLKTCLHSGHSDFCLVSQKRLMHSRQKLCPHGMVTGFLKKSRQMLHRNCSSDSVEAMFLTETNMYFKELLYTPYLLGFGKMKNKKGKIKKKD